MGGRQAGSGGSRVPLLAVCVAALVVLAGCSFSVEVASSDVEFDATTATADPEDVDADGLDVERERALGTDPDDADTDGDRLRDGWEYRNETSEGAALPGADPLHKDLYVQVSYAEGIPRLSETERRNVRHIWAEMNVTNPDGERGIRIHVDDDPPHGGPVNESRTFTTFPEDYLEEQYSRYVPPARQCVYHGFSFVEMNLAETDHSGRGSSPGYASVGAGRREDRMRNDSYGSYNERVRTLTHELLHNVAGNVTNGSDPGHADGEGWLAGFYPPVENESAWAMQFERLAPETAAKLSEDGFAVSRYYRYQVCA